MHDSLPHALPIWATYPDEVFGRTNESVHVHAALQAHRVTTLFGPSGIGKTRLAAEVVRMWEHGPISCVDLSRCSDEHSALQEIAHTLHVHTGPDGDLRDDITDAFSSMPTGALVWLDHLDAVASVLAPALDVWSSSPVSFLTTSRIRLGCPCEHVEQLHPLPAKDAVALFVDRAQHVRRRFALRPDNEPTLHALITALDGIPLAVELAAASMRLLTPKQLLERMERRLDLLVHVDFDLPERHRSLRAALDGSWELLNPDEQALFADCSVFCAPFRLEDLEALCAQTSPNILPVVSMTRLCDASLVRVFEEGEDGQNVRFSLYQSIRDYASEQLDPLTRRDAAERAHAAHFSSLSLRPDHTESILANAPNFWAILQRSQTAKNWPPHYAGHAARALSWLYLVRGPLHLLHDLSNLLAPSLEALSQHRPHMALEVLELQTRADLIAGETERATRTLERADTLLQDTQLDQHPTLHARLLNSRATLARRTQRPQDAITLYTQARDLLEPDLDPFTRSEIVANLGGTYLEVGRNQDALQAMSQALDFARSCDHHVLEGVLLTNLGLVQHLSGSLDDAHTLLTQALAHHRKLHHRRFEGITHNDLALVSLERGDLLKAHALYTRAETLLHNVGDTPHMLLTRACHAVCSALLGDLDRAQTHMQRAQHELEQTPHLHLQDACALYAELMHGLSSHPKLPTHNPQHTSDEIRLALRIATTWTSVLTRSRPHIEVDFDAKQLRTHDRTTWVDLSKKPVVWRVFLAFVTHRLEGQPKPLTPSQLLTSGWPGETIVESAARNRLHVTLNTLRRFGLRNSLTREDDGYRLSRDIYIWFVSKLDLQ